MAVTLSRSSLHELPTRVGRPGYEAHDLKAGIVHFGVGNFHRAHQGSYLDQLFSRNLGREWAVVGAGVMAAEERVRQTLLAQECLSLLVTQSAERSEARVIAPMVDFLPIGDAAALMLALTDPAIRIVSLTVTEGGYFLDSEGRFDEGLAQQGIDAARSMNTCTVFGIIVEALGVRRAAGVPAFTVMSCDNLPHNGNLTRATTVGFARLLDEPLAPWIEANVAFPNGMVDRITPATSDRERKIARDVYGVADEVPVFAEDFIQWVLEDDFPQGRPPLEEAGVMFVKDVTPYEEMKLRILNGSHAMLAYPAALLGIGYAHDAIAHPLIAAMLEKIQAREVIPGVTPVPGMDPANYFVTVRKRFANPGVADTIERLCYDGANRQPKFIVPAIRHALSRGLPIDGLALSSALWCRYCAGTRDDGSSVTPNDPRWPELNSAALRAREDPGEWLAQERVYGTLATDERFASAFAGSLQALWREGVVKSISTFVAA